LVKTGSHSFPGEPAPLIRVRTTRRWCENSRSNRNDILMSRSRLFAIAMSLTLSGETVGAQLKASERGMVAQTIDGTRVTVDYSRPRARGRSPIYGTPMVSWGEVWTPGADEATTLELSRDVRIGGRAVGKGKYSVWTVVRKDSAWTFVLDPKWEQYHTDHPDSNAAQIRLHVTPRAVPPVEVLTWSIDSVRNERMTLTMAWGPIAIDVGVDIVPMYPTAITAEAAAPYLGVYSFAWSDPRNEEPPSTLTIERRGTNLIGRWTPAQFKTLQEFMLVPLGDGRFINGFMRGGELWAVNDESIWTFVMKNGRAQSYENRFGKELASKGERR